MNKWKYESLNKWMNEWMYVWMNETLSRGKILISALYQEVNAVNELIDEWKYEWMNAWMEWMKPYREARSY